MYDLIVDKLTCRTTCRSPKPSPKGSYGALFERHVEVGICLNRQTKTVVMSNAYI